jgi:hypothetical protein
LRSDAEYGSVKSMWFTGAPALEERAAPSPGVVDDLVRDDQAAGLRSLRIEPTEATEKTRSTPASFSAQRLAR